MTQSDIARRSYVHGHAPAEQQRLIDQAELWRDGLILEGTTLRPGTRLLEVGCGAGAVLATLGNAFPEVRLSGVDIEPAQIDFARGYLADRQVAADLQVADARTLPYEDASFDHVWMMWVLEHMTEDDAKAALREVRRVLAPGGTITSIELDYATIKVGPSTAGLDALMPTLVRAMRAFGQSDAGTQLWGWLDETGFSRIDPGERLFSFRGTEAAPMARYLADSVEGALPAIASLAGIPDEETLREGLSELRAFGADSWLRCVIHKARALA
ncbi:class I SAM-dependent methyltransferase [Streptomyces sp. NBC_00878]|uniref:class I SAM-dependent methyltransferase n=1 Tax=Streptomyces sp. NBC_00878 TaxID=2975854 RepID=UPI00224E15A0|nr:class I SAM-dependent methyltransferase [Streptomyces sp. NBC_00878]MCX4903242.1 class I SAM-dependent methyltransferase [Streptomyces sp. NBC_00878]